MTGKNTPHKVNLISLGCSKNLVDSEVLMRQIDANNVEIVHDSNEAADTVIINTCGFIVDAKQESIDSILRFANAKKQGRINNLIVMGCLSERYKDELKKEIPEVDAFYGVSELPAIIENLGFDFKKELLGERKLTTPGHYAYLKIAEGCDQHCSFCAIPAIRGKHKSKSIDELVREAEFLAGKGVKELILISQDLTYYGLDSNRHRMLPDLVKNLVKIKGIEWIRLHYLYPSSFPEPLFEVIRNNDKVCNYIDIPLQHINTQILKSMKRGIDSAKTQSLIDRFRHELPDAAIRTAFIIGYPGETENRYKELKDFIIKNRFERLGLFSYSPEDGTPAFNLKNYTSGKRIQQRIDALMHIQEDISSEINQSRIDKVFKVLIDRKESDYFIGRTEFDSPEVDNEVLIKADKINRIGNFYKVKINASDSFDLFGSFV